MVCGYEWMAIEKHAGIFVTGVVNDIVVYVFSSFLNQEVKKLKTKSNSILSAIERQVYPLWKPAIFVNIDYWQLNLFSNPFFQLCLQGLKGLVAMS